MVDQLQSTISSKSLVFKLKTNLEKINARLASSNNTSISSALTEANAAFKSFFDNLKDPEFVPELFLDGDTARSEVYNSNLKAISQDIERFYVELKDLTNAQIKSYNFSQIVVSDITYRANALASIVLDLNILNGFNRGDTIIAGDDFKTSKYIDGAVALASSKAEVVANGSGISLARKGTESILDSARIEVMPLSPANASGSTEQVNTKPTAGNLERFYEGCYYNFIGLARPEGNSKFNIKYILDTSTIKSNEVGKEPTEKEVGFFVELGASEAAKQSVRKNMIDGDPSVFWECEYLYKAPTSLIPDIVDSVVQDNDSSGGSSSETTIGGTVQVDLEAAEKAARAFDTDTKDLVVDLIITLPQVSSVNYVALNPVIYGSQSFPEVEDIATALDNENEFKTVEGWDSIRFPKTITPEANEFLTDSQVAVTLSPNRNSYIGQGIFSFPFRFAKKIRIRIRSRYPVAAPYERTYALLRRQLDSEVATKTSTKRRFHSRNTSTDIKSTSEIQSKIVKFSYLQTLALDGGISSAKEIAGETEASEKTAKNLEQFKNITEQVAGFAGGFGGPIASQVFTGDPFTSSIANAVFGKSKDVEVSVKLTDSGWTLVKTWNQPQFDIIRYAIGIKELSIARFTYEQVSELVSKPWSSPKEITKVVLYADQFVPKEFPPANNYVEYYIKPDIENASWIRINGLDLPTVFNQDSSIVPRIISFNTEKPVNANLEDAYVFTDTPVKSIRFKAVLRRSDTTEKGLAADSLTPILKSYKLLMTPKDGL